MEEHCSTGQSSQWAVVPMEEEEEYFAGEWFEPAKYIVYSGGSSS
jgi:hypothetical protein